MTPLSPIPLTFRAQPYAVYVRCRHRRAFENSGAKDFLFRNVEPCARAATVP